MLIRMDIGILFFFFIYILMFIYILIRLSEKKPLVL